MNLCIVGLMTTAWPLPEPAKTTLSKLLEVKTLSGPRLTIPRFDWRLDVPAWKYQLKPTAEDGAILAGHQEGHNEILLLRRPNMGEIGIVPHRYKGSCLFNQTIEMPESERGKPIVFCFGGWNDEDWRKYTWRLNGAQIHQSNVPRGWHEPARITLTPDLPLYQSLQFGAANLMEIEVEGLDRSRDFISREALDQYVYDHVLCDQWVASSYHEEIVENWNFGEWSQNETEYVRHGRASDFNLIQTLRSEGENNHCWSLSQTLWHQRENPEWVTDCGLLSGKPLHNTSDAEVGHPACIGEHGFIAVEHPTGIVAKTGEQVQLLVFPGRKLTHGEKLELPAVVWSHDEEASPQEQFHRFIESRSTRGDRILSFYDPYGHNDFGFGQSSVDRYFDESQALASLEQIDRAKKQELEFEYYVLDVGWIEDGGDFKTPRKDLFPNGFRTLVDALHSRGMKFGLWFPTSFADWGIGSRPELESSRIPGPLGHWPERKLNAHGLPEWNFHRLYSLCSEYADWLEAGILHHIRENDLRLVKLDVGSYFSMTSPENGLPGKYSTYWMHSRLLQMAERIKSENKEVRIIWYWGVRSPFILKNADTLFESRLCLEGSNASDVPCWQFRDSAQRNVDLGVWNCPWIPPRCKDSLGILLAKTQWGNFMSAEDLSISIRMELGRGHGMFPQIWGDLRLLTDAQLAEIGKASHWLQAHRNELTGRRQLVGNPGQSGSYGYAYERAGNEARFIMPETVECNFEREMHRLELRTVDLIDGSKRINVEIPSGKRLLVLLQARNQLGTPYRIEQRDDWLRPTLTKESVALPWDLICPSDEHPYVWKGSSWRYWKSHVIVEGGSLSLTFASPQWSDAIESYSVRIGWM